MNIPCFFIPILVGLISAILGYLLGKMTTEGNHLNLKSKLKASEDENERLNYQLYLLQKENSADKTNNLQIELNECMSKNNTLQAEIDDLKSKHSIHSFVSPTEEIIPFNAELASSVYRKKIKQDDLKIVEGIGPKIEELYHKAGIKTWKELSETSVEKSKEILIEAGEIYIIHNPSTWAKQALLAYQGKWQELKDWQDDLNAGKE
ncbi:MULTISPECIES: hypothetical protein [Flavobacterium]|uniref:DUF4332 domain-containing protein n=1 Tax=Flavobacterium hankyongi TaxID=1176532 RepID=A0ABP8ZW97_9FLAO|nr:hypothetical protein [Flavobacterium sp. N1846]